MNGPRIEQYDWAGGREAMLRFGPAGGSTVIAALPLFEEANRTRAFTVAILCALADRGIGSLLPDMPGQGESLTPLESMTLPAMRAAYQGVVAAQDGARCYSIAIRSGALLDASGALAGRWHLAPQDGPSLLRELTRIRQAATGEKPGEHWLSRGEGPIEIAGNLLSENLLSDLAVDEPVSDATVPYRIVRLAGAPAPADRIVDMAPLWRRAEPESDDAAAALLADDIAGWIATCDAS